MKRTPLKMPAFVSPDRPSHFTLISPTHEGRQQFVSSSFHAHFTSFLVSPPIGVKCEMNGLSSWDATSSFVLLAKPE